MAGAVFHRAQEEKCSLIRGLNMKIDPSDPNKSDVNRLLTTLHHQEADRLPHIELWVTSQAVYEYVL